MPPARAVTLGDVMWTVDRVVNEAVQHRNFNMSGGSFVADLALRLEPAAAIAGVVFANAVDDPEADPFLSTVERAVMGFAERWASEGRPLSQLRVTLTAISVHPVDQKAARYAEAAEIAMSRALATCGVQR